MSWVRKYYTTNGQIQLSRELLSAFEHWESETEDASKEEIELATKCFTDFSRLPPAEDRISGINTALHQIEEVLTKAKNAFSTQHWNNTITCCETILELEQNHHEATLLLASTFLERNLNEEDVKQ